MKLNDVQEQIVYYLDKNYIIFDKKFLTKYGGIQEYGCDIISSLGLIFNITLEFSEVTFKFWADSNNFSSKDEKNWRLAYQKNRLKTTWNPEFIPDLRALGLTLVDAETELISLLCEQIQKEINSSAFKVLIPNINTSEKFISVMRCIGYDLGPTIYDMTTFFPIKHFISIPYNEMQNERQNNPLWQDWV